MWIRPWMQRRRTNGAFNTIFKELKEEDADGFKGYIRMNLTQFDHLVELLKPSISKQDTAMRECIKADEMCCVFLRFIASRESFTGISISDK